MKNIDNKIKKLADDQSISPPAFVWGNIENSLRPKKKKKGFYWLILGLFMVASSLIWVFTISKNQSLKDQSFTMPASSKDDTAVDFMPINTKKEDRNEISSQSGIHANKYDPGKTTNSFLLNKKSNIIILTNLQNPVSNSSESTNKTELNYIESKAILEKRSDNQSIKTLKELEPVLEIEHLSINLDYERSFVKFSKIIACPTFDHKKKITTFLEIGGLLGNHAKTIDNGTNNELAALRRGSESSWYTYGIYATAGINITPSFYFGVGVDWTQSKDKFYSAQDAITKMIITFDPNTGIPIDTSLVTGTLVNQGEIKHTSIDIPVFAGFMRHYQSWDFGVELGGVMNLNFVSDGKIYSESSNISHLNKETDVYKSNLGFGLKASLLIRKNLKNGISIQLKPTFKTYFKEINVDSYNLPTKYSVYGINLGLRKDF